MLTAAEQAVMDLTAQLANGLAKIVGDGPTRSADLTELYGHIHGIQHAVMAQAAARDYPERYRLLGNMLPPPTGHTITCGFEGKPC